MSILAFFLWSAIAAALAALVVRARGQRHFTADLQTNTRSSLASMAGSTIGDHSTLASSAEAQRQIRQKATLRARALQNTKPSEQKVKGKDSNGLPSGQVRANKWIVLDLGRPSANEFDYAFSTASWRVDVFVGGEKVAALNRADIEQMRSSTGQWDELHLDWHCVTGWSFEGVVLLGVPFSAVLERIRAKLRASGRVPDDALDHFEALMQVAADGYTCPVLREDVLARDAFFCVGMRDATTGATSIPLPPEHGTVRAVFPNLYGWKSAKCVRELHFLSEYADGFWEKMGCNRRGRWAEEERWSAQSSAAGPIWTVLTFLNDLWRRVLGQTVWIAMMTFGALLVAKWAALAGFFQAQRPTTVVSSRTR